MSGAPPQIAPRATTRYPASPCRHPRSSPSPNRRRRQRALHVGARARSRARGLAPTGRSRLGIHRRWPWRSFGGSLPAGQAPARVSPAPPPGPASPAEESLRLLRSEQTSLSGPLEQVLIGSEVLAGLVSETPTHSIDEVQAHNAAPEPESPLSSDAAHARLPVSNRFHIQSNEYNTG